MTQTFVSAIGMKLTRMATLFQIVDGNAKTDVSNRREPGMFCGEAEQEQTFISETSYVKILFYAENYTDQVNNKGLFAQ